MKHAPTCDGQHTPRQPCNDALAGRAEAVVIEAPSTNGASARDDTVSDGGEHPAGSRPAVATQEMPAPSPEVLRAWEETATAVGATATPAPPAKAIVEGGLARRSGWLAGHTALIAIAAVGAFVLLFIIRRRR